MRLRRQWQWGIQCSVVSGSMRHVEGERCATLLLFFIRKWRLSADEALGQDGEGRSAMGAARRREIRLRGGEWGRCLVVSSALGFAGWLAVFSGKLVGASYARKGKSDSLVLRNKAGIEVHLLQTGASIQRLLLPDRDGKLADVVLGFDEEARYSDGTSPYFGAIVGRVANRIANASFVLDGKTYRLATNEGGMPGTLHGGTRGFDKVRWAATRLNPYALKHRRRGDAISMRYVSQAGEEGYPGTLDVEVTYTLNDDDELVQSIRATTDAPTILVSHRDRTRSNAAHGPCC